MSKGPPKLQTAQQNPPYDVFSASPGRGASDLGRGGPLPSITADQNSHGRNYMVLAAEFGCGCSCVCNNISLYAAQGEEIRAAASVYQMYSIISCI